MPHKDPEARSAYMRAYHQRTYELRKDKIQERNKRWRVRNEDARREYDREYQRHRFDNRPEAKAIWEQKRRAYIAKHPDYQRRYALMYRTRILELLGPVCARCGFDDRRVLQIDHVHGGGSKIKRETYRESPKTYYKKMREEIEAGSREYQILCANCNTIKKYEDNPGMMWA